MNDTIKELYFNDYLSIYVDKKFNINQFQIKRWYFWNILFENKNISLKTANKVLTIFNKYYQKNLEIDDLFNIKNIIWYSRISKKKFHFSYSSKDFQEQHNPNNFLDNSYIRLLDKIFNMFMNLIEITFNAKI